MSWEAMMYQILYYFCFVVFCKDEKLFFDCQTFLQNQINKLALFVLIVYV
jgi:hypothetical protein